VKTNTVFLGCAVTETRHTRIRHILNSSDKYWILN
jgi:hypothetical protein